jgi:hypothetical protein
MFPSFILIKTKVKRQIKTLLLYRIIYRSSMITLVLIKINDGNIGDQKGSFIQQTQIIMGLRIFYP